MVILTLHLLACLLYVGATFSSIVLHVPSFSLFTSWRSAFQFSMIGFSMSGVPIIISAMYGVLKHIHAAVRLYFIYVSITFVLEAAALIYTVARKGGCEAPDGFLNIMAADVGQAFLCGALQAAAYLCVSVGVTVGAYRLFIVWSLCEDIREGGSGKGLWDLLPGKEPAFSKKSASLLLQGQGPYADTTGMAHSKLPGSYPLPYGAVQVGAPSIILFEDHFSDERPEMARW
jgi:hypothetical protein